MSLVGAFIRPTAIQRDVECYLFRQTQWDDEEKGPEKVFGVLFGQVWSSRHTCICGTCDIFFR